MEGSSQAHELRPLRLKTRRLLAGDLYSSDALLEVITLSLSFLIRHQRVRPLAWRPIDHRQSYHVLCPATETPAPGRDAGPLACSIVYPRGDSSAWCVGLDLGGGPFGKLAAQPRDRCIDLLRASRSGLAGKPGGTALQGEGGQKYAWGWERGRV
jgi:hypothetical protein